MPSASAAAIRSVVSILVIGLAAAADASAQQSTPAEVSLEARRAATPPTLDGVLDDEVWSGDPLPLGGWVSYNPLRGEPAQQQTRVWIGYDAEALYFAFRCLDAEPSRIRSTITRRDNAWNDDWVAVSLDSSRAGQIAYHMFTNPSGIQMDGLNSGAGGEDMSPDWVWQSAGRVDDQGYVVEMRVPLEAIRFRGGAEVRMGILFFRRNSRLGISWAWPEIAPGKWVFETHVPILFRDLEQRRVLEVIPSATFSANQTRTPGAAWPDTRSRGDVGASVKYGLTSTVTLDATVNPDFSQVESDAFQVEVNQRFPVFFSEKRPFFMEGLGLFNLAGSNGDDTLLTAVHTRRIVDPKVGLKITGTAGRQTFAVLSSADESPPTDKDRVFTIGRLTRNLGQGEYVGALVTSTEYGQEHNRVAAADIALRHGEHFSWSAALMQSSSRGADGRDRAGVGGRGTYAFSTRRLNVVGQIEHFDTGFQMDTAFLQRVGVTRLWQYEEVQFYPDQKRHGWLKRIAPFVWLTRAEDRIQGGSEQFVLPGIRFNFTRQANVRLDVGRGHETFAGRRFTTGRRHIDAGAQLLRWLNLSGSIDRGRGIFYDRSHPFGGIEIGRSVRVGLQPNANLSHNLAYNYVRFERDGTGEPVFAVHILNLRTTYQFTPQFLVRAIAQYDSGRRRVLGDFLASFELSPGTVVHAGYGTLLEDPDRRRYGATARAFFFKAGYLFRL
jgi:hypothetical protein